MAYITYNCRLFNTDLQVKQGDYLVLMRDAKILCLIRWNDLHQLQQLEKAVKDVVLQNVSFVCSSFVGDDIIKQYTKDHRHGRVFDSQSISYDVKQFLDRKFFKDHH